ncbi:unnamed protein product [Adineta ricciae]|uniref:Uncharacterized protein n=1 Tax=Adineta ricciae TaxID=249248 RepID=A0A814CNX0_ADIRI|nr:unnamed protein product [Adineta ricciae]CAF1584601.1 unnamed protein product [Adineta ricciae]
MATTSSPAPMLFSVLTSSHDDFVTQLRNHLTQIENNVHETLNKVQQRMPYKPIEANNSDGTDTKGRLQFYDVLKDVAINNNLQFDESFFRKQFLDKQDSSPKVDVVRAKPLITTDTTDHPQLSPVNNARRSQFAPVLSSTPVHQTSPITPIPVDLTMATSSAAPVLTMNSNDLPTVLPSAIAPQRANVTRPAGRPPRIPRGESVSRQKKKASPIKEQNEETVLTREIQITTKRRIKTKQEVIEDNIEVVIEQQTEILPDMMKQVQATPLRGRKKKMVQDDANLIPQLEPPALPPTTPTTAPAVEKDETIPKKTRTGRNKKKDDEDSKPKRTASARNRKKQQQEEGEQQQEDVPVAPKKTTRNKKLVEPTTTIEENPPPPPPSVVTVRATPSRGKKKSPVETVVISPPKTITPPTPKKTTKSKKRKDLEITNENPTDTIHPPSPKRRGGRNTKSKNASPVEPIVTPPLIEQTPQLPASTRSSRRGKRDIEIPIEKQENIVLTKKPRTGRGKKTNEPNNTDMPVTVVDVVMTSVTVSAPVPSTTDLVGAKPPRPPVARKKKSLAMPPVSQMSPSTPPPTQRIPSTSPINDKPLLPIPVPTNGGRRRQQQRRIVHSPHQAEESTLETIPSITRNQKRTQSSTMSTPKRARRDNLLVITVPSTPGKKRNKCTCEKRRHRICDICATAVDT